MSGGEGDGRRREGGRRKEEGRVGAGGMDIHMVRVGERYVCV